MKLAELTWKDVDNIDRDVVVLIPTGSLEQHGAHLPLFTDSILVSAAAEAIEAKLSEQVLLTPTVWLGCSSHHLPFAGSLTASFNGYHDSLVQIVDAMVGHGFTKFMLINGHGGNTAPNSIACREFKDNYPELTFVQAGYFQFIDDAVLAEVMEGPAKGIQHACEAETSLMLHIAPDLVRPDKLRDDGFHTEPKVEGVTLRFDEWTEEGSLGYATLGTAEKGRRLFESAVEGACTQVSALANGFVLMENEPK